MWTECEECHRSQRSKGHVWTGGRQTHRQSRTPHHERGSPRLARDQLTDHHLVQRTAALDEKVLNNFHISLPSRKVLLFSTSDGQSQSVGIQVCASIQLFC